MPKLIISSKCLRLFLLSFLISGLLLSFCSQPARAATTYYVSPQGRDTNNGSQTAPFLTLQKAVSVIAAGDKVIVKDGTYAGAEISRGGTSSAWITIQSENKHGAKIVSPQALGYHGFYFYPTANYINIVDFDISGGQAAFMSDAGGHDLTFKGNNIHDVGRFCTSNTIGLVGLYMEDSTNITFEGNKLQKIGRFSNGESGCQNSNNYYQSHDHGVYINGSINVLIKNNVFIDFNNGWPIQIYSGGGGTSSNVKIYNNTFAFDNPYKVGQIILAGSINGLQIKNNIFYQPRTAALDFYQPSMSNVTVTNNLVYGGPMYAVNNSGISYTNNKENTNPLVVNAPSFDFSLQAASPALNIGLSLSEVPTDINGTTRPQGSGYDLGAYEFGTTIIPSVTPIVCVGDINGDKVVDLTDYSILVANFLKTGSNSADLNKDGIVDLRDYSALVLRFLKPCGS